MQGKCVMRWDESMGVSNAAVYPTEMGLNRVVTTLLGFPVICAVAGDVTVKVSTGEFTNASDCAG
jgi:hypothetical protein